MKSRYFINVLIWTTIASCGDPNQSESSERHDFPAELVHFNEYAQNPVFKGSDTLSWDHYIRERGFILREDSAYYLWYTGYPRGDADEKHLGYATSPDGLRWTRYQQTAIYSAGWVEDIFVIKSDSLYYMFAEGKGDTAHLLTSSDRLHWEEQGSLQISKKNGLPIDAGAFGTPCVLKEDNTWYLFYERNDLGIWLAKSRDGRKWTNVQDEPVLAMGPEEYDKYAVAMNQVIKYKGRYYGYYHGSAFRDWHEWSTNIAVSDDLIHWKKYSQNPLVGQNRSSAIVVNDGQKFRLYTMHPEVRVYLPVSTVKH